MINAPMCIIKQVFNSKQRVRYRWRQKMVGFYSAFSNLVCPQQKVVSLVSALPPKFTGITKSVILRERRYL